MQPFNFNNKTFYLLENSSEGKVNQDTLFKYSQKNNLITATYKGGPVVHGEIIATLSDNTLNMLYHCITTDNELKAGQALAKVSNNNNNNNKLQLDLEWEWIGLHRGNGTSTYIEL